MVRPKIETIKSPEMSKILVLISKGVTSPRAIARSLNKSVGTIGNQLLYLKKNHYVIDGKTIDRRNNKSIYAIDFETLIKDLIDLLGLEYKYIINNLKLWVKWLDTEPNLPYFKELSLSEQRTRQDKHFKNKEAMIETIKGFEIEFSNDSPNGIYSNRDNFVHNKKLQYVLRDYIYYIAPILLNSNDMTIEKVLIDFLQHIVIFSNIASEQTLDDIKLKASNQVKLRIKKQKKFTEEELGFLKEKADFRLFISKCREIKMIKEKPFYLQNMVNSLSIALYNHKQEDFISKVNNFENEIKKKSFDIAKENKK